MKKKIILASASPRRQELLTQIGLDFEVHPSDWEEKTEKELPGEVVQKYIIGCRSARGKALLKNPWW